MSGTAGRVLGVIGGATLTQLAMGFVPSSLNSGFLGYVSTGVVAMLQGKLVGKVFKNGQLGTDFTTGGLVYLAIKVINDFIPSLGGSLGLSGMGRRGMGLIAPGSFYLPQVNKMGSMGNYVLPSAIPTFAPQAATGTGVGNMRRGGRLR